MFLLKLMFHTTIALCMNIVFIQNIDVATLALGSQPKQGLAKWRAKREP
jgi:hypothetical protein